MNKSNPKKWFLYFVIFIGIVGVIVGIILAITNKNNPLTPPPVTPPPVTPPGGGGFKPPNGTQVEKTIAALQYANAIMYGAESCGNTQAQLALFEGKLPSVTNPSIYVQCAKDTKDIPIQQCMTYFKQFTQNGNINIAYPTWSINGKKIEGVQQLTDLYTYAVGSPSSSISTDSDFNSGSNDYSTKVTFTEIF